MRDEGDRFVAWRLDDAPATPDANLEEERMERALLAYAHRSAARAGAEWFAAEFARREEADRLDEARDTERREALDTPAPAPSREITLIDASVEHAVVGGAAIGLGLEPPSQKVPENIQPAQPPPEVAPPVAAVSVKPEAVKPDRVPTATVTPEPTPQPALRHPHVPRPPAVEPVAEHKRRRRYGKRVEPSAPASVISAPEWARMSPGARRLYGLDAAPTAAGTG